MFDFKSKKKQTHFDFFAFYLENQRKSQVCYLYDISLGKLPMLSNEQLTNLRKDNLDFPV